MKTLYGFANGVAKRHSKVFKLARPSPIMANTMKVKHYPLSTVARTAILLGFLVNIATLAIVAMNYGVGGVTGALLIAPGIFMAVFIVLLLVLRYRYALLERYPYLVSMPAFVYRLGMNKNADVQARIISRVFTVHSFAVLYISVLGFVITNAEVMRSASLSWLAPAIIVVVAVFVVTVFLIYRSIYMSFAAKR